MTSFIPAVTQSADRSTASSRDRRDADVRWNPETDAHHTSLWLGEHIVLPADYGSEHPTTGDTAHQHHPGPIVDPTTKLLDPLVALAACASVTTHLRLATGIFILPLRHPLLTARMTLTLQELAGGRFVLGVGAGWLEEEFDALDVPFDDRAARMDETLTILRQAWSGDTFAHDGSLFTFGNVQLTPEPVDVPLILGGNSERALRRAATAGDGWFSSGTPSFDDAVRLRDRLVELRDPGRTSGEFPIYVRVAHPDQADLARYQAAGFEHVLIWADQLWPAEGDLDHKRTTFAAAAADLGVQQTRLTLPRTASRRASAVAARARSRSRSAWRFSRRGTPSVCCAVLGVVYPFHQLERDPFGALEEAEPPADVVHLLAEHRDAVRFEMGGRSSDVVDP